MIGWKLYCFAENRFRADDSRPHPDHPNETYQLESEPPPPKSEPPL
jgi:hypothetical protein